MWNSNAISVKFSTIKPELALLQLKKKPKFMHCNLIFWPALFNSTLSQGCQFLVVTHDQLTPEYEALAYDKGKIKLPLYIDITL